MQITFYISNFRCFLSACLDTLNFVSLQVFSEEISCFNKYLSGNVLLFICFSPHRLYDGGWFKRCATKVEKLLDIWVLSSHRGTAILSLVSLATFSSSC